MSDTPIARTESRGDRVIHKEVATMNINPSDMDVRQGYSLAESAATVQVGSPVSSTREFQGSSALQAMQQQAFQEDGTDARSLAAAAIADKSSAKEAAQKLATLLNAKDTGLKIRVLDDSENRVQVEIVDEKSNKVIRKIPQDELLKLSASIKEMNGALLDKPA